MNEQQKELLDSLKFICEANPKDSSKNKLLKNWFNRYFSSGRGATVNESKQASNRIKEQFAHADEHVIFIYHDEQTREYLLRHAKQHIYKKLNTVVLCSGKFEFTDMQVFVQETPFEDFVVEFNQKVKLYDLTQSKAVKGNAGGLMASCYNKIFFGPPALGKAIVPMS